MRVILISKHMRNPTTLLLVGAGLGLAFGLAVLPAKAETYSCNGDPMYARNLSGKTVTGARIRTQPCMEDSEIITVAPSGASLKILAEMDGWYKVQYGEVVGWMGGKLVQTGAPIAVEDKPVAAKAKADVEIPKGIPQIIGISEKNFGYLKALNATLLKRTKGKIVMRVQSRGQLYYVTSKGPQLLEVKKLAELDQEDLTVAQVAKPMAAGGTLKLNAETAGGKVILRWDVNGVDAAQGFKLVVSEEANPVYPGDDYRYLPDPAARSFVWDGLESGKTYHFRVCQYLGGSCGAYSNDDVVTMPGAAVSQAPAPQTGAISLAGSVVEGKAELTWTLSGFEPSLGFKVVKAEHAAPVYPGDDYHYLSDPQVRSDEWSGLGSGQTYHFRVCQYLGGKCGIYSNDLQLLAP